MKYKIYKLKDPYTKIIVYIGITTRSIQARLVGHLHDAYHRDRLYPKKSLWIKDLVNKNRIPLVELIEETEDINREKYWIQEYHPIFNIVFNRKVESTKGKRVYQYDLEGNFINEYKSLAEAARINNLEISNIQNCTIGSRNKSGDYIWKDFKENKIDSYTRKNSKKEIHMYSLDGNYIQSFKSAHDVEGFSNKVISKCCNGDSKTYKGYRFSFEKKERI